VNVALTAQALATPHFRHLTLNLLYARFFLLCHFPHLGLGATYVTSSLLQLVPPPEVRFFASHRQGTENNKDIVLQGIA
jgi:hypothetical protein